MAPGRRWNETTQPDPRPRTETLERPATYETFGRAAKPPAERPVPTWRSRLRDLAVGLASAGVLTFLVAYTLAAPSADLEASIGAAVPRPGSAAFVLGRIRAADGSGLAGAKVVVRRSGAVAGAAVSDGSGAFRVELRGSCSLYSISLSARAEGATLGAGDRRELCPGDALPVEARVVTQGHFLWVPGPR